MRRTEVIRRLAAQSLNQSRRSTQYPAANGATELRQRADLVAREAEHRLAGIQKITDLSPFQEDALFGIYAGASPAYDPSMFVAMPSVRPDAISYPSETRVPTVGTRSPVPPAVAAPVASPVVEGGRVATAPAAASPAAASPSGSAAADASVTPTDRQLAQIVQDDKAAAPSLPANTDEQVLAVLEPDQQVAVLEAWEQDDALWGFIVDDLNQELDDAVDAALELLDQQAVPGTPVDGAYAGQDLLLVQP